MASRRTTEKGKRRKRRRGGPPRPRSRRPAIVGVVLLILALLAIADRRGWLLVAAADEAVYHGTHTTVERVIDGDTLIVALPDAREGGAATRVRLWGIDAPEMARPFNTPPVPGEPFAQEATDLLRDVCAEQEVLLLLEPHRPRDRYGRLLAHVVLPDGRHAAELLVEAGLARADERWPHRYLERLEQLETQAQRAGVGMWSAP